MRICIKNKYLTLLILMLLPFKIGLASYNIGPDDVLRISVYGYDDLKIDTRVSTDGRITFPLIGEVEASGKTSLELQAAIAKRLVDGQFIQEPQVSVTVSEHVSQQVSVLGYVNKPGRYHLYSNSSVVDLIALAGGIQDIGDSQVVISRNNGEKLQKIVLNLKDYLESTKSIAPYKIQVGDVLFVPKAPMFYIYGEVQHPGGYRLEPDISVIKALSLGGGLTLRGSENRVLIKRKTNGVLKEIDADLSNGILKDDVIYVGERWF